MALAEGSGMYQPKPPKPQVSYGAPSGPYAQPAGAPQGNYGYTPISTLSTPLPQPAQAAPLGAVGGFLKGAVTAFDPRSMWQGAKVVATGLRHPIMPGSDEWRKQMMVELAGLKQQASTPEGAGALATLAIPGLGLAKAPSLAGRLGKGASELGDAARVVSYPAGEVTNPGLLSRMSWRTRTSIAISLWPVGRTCFVVRMTRATLSGLCSGVSRLRISRRRSSRKRPSPTRSSGVRGMRVASLALTLSADSPWVQAQAVRWLRSSGT